MRTEWSNKDSLEIPEITCGYGSLSWSDYKTGTSCDIAAFRLPIIEAIPVEWIRKYIRKPINNADYWAIMRMVTEWEKENDD